MKRTPRKYTAITILNGLLVAGLLFYPFHAYGSQEPKNPVYRIGSEDALDISILQPQALSVSVSVSPDGTITFPYVGNISAKGKTLDEFQESLRQSLSSFMQYPVVSVSLKESKSRRFFVYGEVARPGEFPMISQDVTVLRAVAMAGGLTQRAWPVEAKLIRKGKDGIPQTIVVNLKKAESDASQDLPVNSGDILAVPEGRFFVYGEVTRPGEFPAQNDVTVMRAVAMAGGISRYGFESKVKLIRPRADGNTEIIPVNLRAVESDPSSDVPVLPGDVVHVSASESRFFVYGEVTRPGEFPAQNDVTVMRAVAMAGGLSKYGSASKVKLIRQKADGNNDIIPVNLKSVENDPSSDVAVLSGDVIHVSEGSF